MNSHTKPVNASNELKQNSIVPNKGLCIPPPSQYIKPLEKAPIRNKRNPNKACLDSFIFYAVCYHVIEPNSQLLITNT